MGKLQTDNTLKEKKPFSVVFSKINVRRNIDKYKFVKLMTEESKRKFEFDVIDYVSNWNSDTLMYDLSEMGKSSKKQFLDEDLIDNSFYDQEDGKFVLLNKNISILINDHDHLNLFIVTPDLSLTKAYNDIEVVENKLGRQFPYAVSNRYGYLTSSIKDCGMGMKIYVLLHLYGLVKNEKLEEALKLFTERGYMINEWIYDTEDKEQKSEYYVISSNLNFGVSEKNLITRFLQGINDLIKFNHESLIEYYNKNKIKLVDTIFRSYGILKYAHCINYREALEHLSNIRIGLELELDLPASLNDLNKSFVQIKDGFVGKLAQEENIEDDVARARIIKSNLR